METDAVDLHFPSATTTTKRSPAAAVAAMDEATVEVKGRNGVYYKVSTHTQHYYIISLCYSKVLSLCLSLLVSVSPFVYVFVSSI